MSSPAAPGVEDTSGRPKTYDDANPPTFAAFSPSIPSSPSTKQRSTILVHRKSPLLAATPPAVTRALAFSHPFILPLNHVAGLLTWSTGDPWESFLVIAGFWVVTLYGEVAIKYAGPVIVVIAVILGMYSRRYSPLSSTSWTGEKEQSKPESSAKHQKSLDEILDTLNTFTARCNGLIEPFIHLTDFLSTQRTATSATTRPALTSLFIRILFVTPIWIVLTFPPLYLLNTRRVVLAAGTMALSWHSRPARVTRTILWRSQLIRRVLTLSTGLQLGAPPISTKTRKGPPPPLPPRGKHQQDFATTLPSRIPAESSGVRFTFVVFENQRRWLGIGWTSTMLAYERTPWTDEHLNPSDPRDEFQLPGVDNGSAQWRWVPGSEWQVEGPGKTKASAKDDGWIYYDNKWNDGRRGQDGWGKYTRRRKWYRDAELVETSPGSDEEPSRTSGDGDSLASAALSSEPTNTIMTPNSTDEPSHANKDREGTNGTQTTRRRGFFRRSRRLSTPTIGEFFSLNSPTKDSSGTGGNGSHGNNPNKQNDSTVGTPASFRNVEDEDEMQLPPAQQHRDGDWDVGDDVKMGLG